MVFCFSLHDNIAVKLFFMYARFCMGSIVRQRKLRSANKVNHSGYKRDWTTSDCGQLLI